MTHDVSLFKELDKSYFSKVKIGIEELVDVKGKGMIEVETSSGTKFISNVLFVPDISQSLLSVGKMLEKNYVLHFQDMSCFIFDPTGSELMTVKMKNKSFPIEWKQSDLKAYASVMDDSILWHKILGHYNNSA